MGLDFDQLFPNRFIKAGEFKDRDVMLTISRVEIEELEGDKGKQVKGIISFKESPKQFVLNKTNGLCLRAMWGRNTADWLGKRVVLYPAKIDFGDSDIAIRVRGSPDIPADIEFELKLARKKPRKVTLKKIGTKSNGKPAPITAPVTTDGEPPPEPEPGSDLEESLS